MKIDVTQSVTDLQRKPIGQLRQVLTQSLDTLMRGDENLTGDEKRHLARLAQKIADEDTPDLPLSDWSKINARVERAYPPVIVLRVSEMLDPPAPDSVAAE